MEIPYSVIDQQSFLNLKSALFSVSEVNIFVTNVVFLSYGPWFSQFTNVYNLFAL